MEIIIHRKHGLMERLMLINVASNCLDDYCSCDCDNCGCDSEDGCHGEGMVPDDDCLIGA